MSTQIYIDFSKPIVHRENNAESQKIFDDNRDKFSAQCRRIYEAMLRGERLTTKSALIDYDVGDLRRRVKDLKDMWNIPVESVLIKGNYKEYFITSN